MPTQMTHGSAFVLTLVFYVLAGPIAAWLAILLPWFALLISRSVWANIELHLLHTLVCRSFASGDCAFLKPKNNVLAFRLGAFGDNLIHHVFGRLHSGRICRPACGTRHVVRRQLRSLLAHPRNRMSRRLDVIISLKRGSSPLRRRSIFHGLRFHNLHLHLRCSFLLVSCSPLVAARLNPAFPLRVKSRRGNVTTGCLLYPR